VRHSKIEFVRRFVQPALLHAKSNLQDVAHERGARI
jgi:hypothetical protein